MSCQEILKQGAYRLDSSRRHLAGGQVVTARFRETLQAQGVATAVVSCTDLRTDGARNAIPSNVTITGDTRSFDPAVCTASLA